MKKSCSGIFLFLLFFACSLAAKGQPDSIHVSTSDSLFYRTPIFSLYPKLFNNGRQLSHEEAIQLLSKEPTALANYRKYRNRQKIGLYSALGVFGFIGLSTQFFQKGNRSAAGVGMALSVYSFINSIVFLSLADGKLRTAVKQYNQRLLRY